MAIISPKENVNLTSRTLQHLFRCLREHAGRDVRDEVDPKSLDLMVLATPVLQHKGVEHGRPLLDRKACGLEGILDWAARVSSKGSITVCNEGGRGTVIEQDDGRGVDTRHVKLLHLKEDMLVTKGSRRVVTVGHTTVMPESVVGSTTGTRAGLLTATAFFCTGSL